MIAVLLGLLLYRNRCEMSFFFFLESYPGINFNLFAIYRNLKALLHLKIKKEKKRLEKNIKINENEKKGNVDTVIFFFQLFV